jgi:hypothetical protein
MSCTLLPLLRTGLVMLVGVSPGYTQCDPAISSLPYQRTFQLIESKPIRQTDTSIHFLSPRVRTGSSYTCPDDHGGETLSQTRNVCVCAAEAISVDSSINAEELPTWRKSQRGDHGEPFLKCAVRRGDQRALMEAVPDQ